MIHLDEIDLKTRPFIYWKLPQDIDQTMTAYQLFLNSTALLIDHSFQKLAPISRKSHDWLWKHSHQKINIEFLKWSVYLLFELEIGNWKKSCFEVEYRYLFFLVIHTSWKNHTPLTRLSFFRFVFLATINVSLFLIVLILYWTYSSNCSSFSVFGFPETNWTFQPHLPCFFFKSVRSIWVKR